jgi:Transposase DDE domain
MDDPILAIYCLCDDLLKALRHREDPQREMSDAEVMTTALVGVLFFCGNYERARRLLGTPRYMPRMLSKSRFCRRLHALDDLFRVLFALLGRTWRDLSTESLYLIDSFPIPALDPVRRPHARLYPDPAFVGYIPSKHRYFVGLRLYLLTTATGELVEAFLMPGSTSDPPTLWGYEFDLPEGSTLYADKGFTLYAVEDVLAEAQDTRLLPLRKKNSRRKLPACTEYLQLVCRKRIETTGSGLSQLLPKTIHAVTPEGFELKAFLFVLAYSISCAL